MQQYPCPPWGVGCRLPGFQKGNEVPPKETFLSPGGRWPGAVTGWPNSDSFESRNKHSSRKPGSVVRCPGIDLAFKVKSGTAYGGWVMSDSKFLLIVPVPHASVV